MARARGDVAAISLSPPARRAVSVGSRFLFLYAHPGPQAAIRPGRLVGADPAGFGQLEGDALDATLAAALIRRCTVPAVSPMRALANRFIAIENLIHRELVRYSLAALRVTVGAVFLGFGAERKLQIVLEGVRDDCSVSELCDRHGISQAVYCDWRDHVLDGATRSLLRRENIPAA